ncbi:MAG TPA: thrombospondin type 3 repeat-containing protein [Candidatus Polarisedimenticolia bacterium]|nr:thrombospondin type 3 repeat-containing protein [Candidatus Polarisedimenticolia bacterium]
MTLLPVAGSPGLYRGSIGVSSTIADATHLFSEPGADVTYTATYRDPLCDGDRDGQAAEDDVANLDGDGIPAAGDKCPDVYDPAQTDTDADGFGDLCDDCPTAADPTQADTNQDGVGDLCEYDDMDGDTIPNLSDNCPDVRNPNQSDLEPDGRGDLCDTLKTNTVTFGGANGVAQCDTASHTCLKPSPAVGDPCSNDEQCIRTCDPTGHCSNTGGYGSPTPAVGATCTLDSDCYRDIDRDADGVNDALDTCVLAKNGPLGGPSDQTDGDGDGLGDACDPDCAGVAHASVCRANGAACPTPETNQTIACANPFGLGVVCQHYLTNAGACSAVDDDADADGVADLTDDCPTIANPAVVAGSTRQADRDRDGRGDACDPAGALDDDGDTAPDDIVTFNGTIACRQEPLAYLQVVSVVYQDLDGDHDTFPDTAETGRLEVTVRNLGARLTDVRMILVSADPDVACITGTTLSVPSIEAGALVTLGSLAAGPPGWTLTASNALQAQPPPVPPPTVDLRLDVLSTESSGTRTPLIFSLLADVDAFPGVPHVFVPGPDGIVGTADDGTVKESFDVDRDGDGNYTVLDTFKRPIAPGVNRGTCSNAPRTTCATAGDCPAAVPAPICQTGSYLRGSATGVDAGTVAAVSCGGFDTSANNALCDLNPAYPMDWHLHCPPGATNCPNVETGACVGSCDYATPVGESHVLSAPNSLHMGAHNSAFGPDYDTTHLRTLQGFVTPPFNLALVPRLGDLDLSFFQIARLMDNNGVGGVNPDTNKNQCVDCADVQIQVDRNPDPDIDDWGTWDKLVPYQNVYDHKPNAWSTFGSYYCLFTPTDTGTAPPAPRGVHETICYPLGAWSHCGSTIGTVAAQTTNCPGPGTVEPSGVGVWVQTRFDLHGYIGQRVRVRWIAETWNFGLGINTYNDQVGDPGPIWGLSTQEDGWWLDDIVLTGVVTDQVAPIPDTKPRTGTCPSDPCDATLGDAGTAVVLSVTDAAGTPIAGSVVAGQPIQVRASGSSFPGGCVGGMPEFEFSRDGVVVQPFGAPSTLADAPEATALYRVRIRCTTDPGCTSLAGGTVQVAVRSGDGGDAAFGTWASPFNPATGVVYDRMLGTTTLNWGAPGPQGFDLYRGVIGGTSRGHLVNGAWLLDVGPPPGSPPTCLLNGVSGTPAPSDILGGVNGTSGALNQAADPNPPVGGVSYYLVVRASSGGTAVNAFGCANPTVCRNTGWCALGTDPGRPCAVNADCPGGGTCAAEATFCRTDAGPAHLGGCARHTICAGGSSPGALCETNADCPGGGSCPGLSAGVTTAGAVCLNTSLDPPASGVGVPVNGCPGRTSVRRITRTAPAPGLCP